MSQISHLGKYSGSRIIKDRHYMSTLLRLCSGEGDIWLYLLKKKKLFSNENHIHQDIRNRTLWPLSPICPSD